MPRLDDEVSSFPLPMTAFLEPGIKDSKELSLCHLPRWEVAWILGAVTPLSLSDAGMWEGIPSSSAALLGKWAFFSLSLMGTEHCWSLGASVGNEDPRGQVAEGRGGGACTWRGRGWQQ